jgi:ubiquinone biosynthesis protein
MAVVPWMLRDLGRVRRIAGVLTRHGFQDIAARLGPLSWLRSVVSVLSRRPRQPSIPIGRRIRTATEELGPTFVKLGQMLATRPDLIPMDVVQELRHLQDEVPPFPFEQVRAIVEADLGRPVEAVFAEVESQPIAAASIAQVHRARLKDGADVVIKVQRPNLNEVIGSDLRILSGLARTLEQRVSEIRPFRPSAIVEEFRRSLKREMDFTTEMASMERYRAMFADEPGLHVPRPYPEFSGRRVLVMERVEGIKVSDRAALEAAGIDLPSIVETGMHITLRSIFEFGFFHADPHPGNFFVRTDGTIVLLDFGMMGTLEPRRLDEMLAFMVAVLTADVDMVVNQLLDADLIGDETDLRSLRGELQAILDRYRHVRLGGLDVAGFLNELADVTIRHHVVLPADLLLVGKSIATMEGLGHELYPEFEPLEAIRPYLTEVYVKRMLDAKRHSQTVARSVLDGLALLKEAPFDVRRVLRKLRRNELGLVLRSADHESRVAAASARTNRLVFGGLFAVFFFGGVVLMDSDSTLRIAAGIASEVLAWGFLMGLGWSIFQGERR